MTSTPRWSKDSPNSLTRPGPRPRDATDSSGPTARQRRQWRSRCPRTVLGDVEPPISGVASSLNSRNHCSAEIFSATTVETSRSSLRSAGCRRNLCWISTSGSTGQKRTVNSCSVGSGSTGWTSTDRTRADRGPRRTNATNCSNTRSSPCARISTDPFGALRTQPTRPNSLAMCATA